MLNVDPLFQPIKNFRPDKHFGPKATCLVVSKAG